MLGHSSKVLDIFLASMGEYGLCNLGEWSGGRVRRKMEDRKKEERMPAVFLYDHNTVGLARNRSVSYAEDVSP